MFNKTHMYQAANGGNGDDLGGGADRGDTLDLDLELDLEEADKEEQDSLGFDEETEEEREERLAAEEKAERERNIRIPKYRHDEEVGRARARAEAAEREAEELRAKLEGSSGKNASVPDMAEVANYIAQLEDQYEELVIDGEKEEARAVRTKLNEARDYVTQRRIEEATQATQERTLGSLKYEAVLAQIEATYPALNPSGKDYDAATASEVADLTRTFMQAGQNNVAALQRATKLLLGNAAPAESLSKQRRKEIPTLPGLPGQPKSIASGRTASYSKEAVHTMSQEAFAKLDERTLAKARGDYL